MENQSKNERNPNQPLRNTLSEFGQWARAKAVVMRIESIPEVEWSKEALIAFKKADSGEESDINVACEYMLNEWNQNNVTDILSKELSLVLALATPSTSESYNLYHPLWSMALRAPHSVSGTRFAIGKAPTFGQDWVLKDNGDPDIEQWVSVGKRELEAYPNNPIVQNNYSVVFKATAAFEKKSIPGSLMGMAVVAVESVLGPAKKIIHLAQDADFKKISSRSVSTDYKNNLSKKYGKFVQKNAMAKLASFRPIIAALPEVQGRAELARAVGVAGSKAKEYESGVGWLWSLDSESGQQWDPILAHSLSRQCDFAWERLESWMRGDVSKSDFGQLVCDLMLTSLSPWVDNYGRGVNNRAEKIKVFDRFVDRKLDKTYLGWFEESLTSDLSTFIMELDDPSKSDECIENYKSYIARGSFSDYSNRDHNSIKAMREFNKLLTHGGHLESIWSRDILALKKEAIERFKTQKKASESKKENVQEVSKRETLLKCADFLSEKAEESATKALAVASAREMKWAKDHSLASAANKIELGAGASLSFDDLEKESARNRVAKATSPSSKFWVALEAAMVTMRQIQGVDARKKARNALAKFGLGSERIEAFVKTPQCSAYLEVLEKSLLLAHQAEERDFKAHKNYVKKDIDLSAKAFGLLIAFESASREDATNEKWGAKGSLDPLWIEELSLKIVDASHDSRQKIYINWLTENFSFTPFTDQSSLMNILTKHFGAKGSFDWLSARFEELSLQSGKLARYVYGDEKHLHPVFFENFNKDKWIFSSKNSYDTQYLNKLPYGWDGEAMLPGANIISKSGISTKKEVNDMIIEAGFIGKMAHIAMVAGRKPEIHTNASLASEANAWLALGKQVAKDFLGLTEASFKSLRKSQLPEVEEQLISLARDKALNERIERAEKSALKEGNVEGELGRLIVEASSRGLPVECADAAKNACSMWLKKTEKLGTGSWFKKGLSPLDEGCALSETIAVMGLEIEKATSLKIQLEVAFLERAGELWKKNQKNTASHTDQVSPTDTPVNLSETLCSEVSDMTDWVNDWAGRFWCSLPNNFSYKDLLRGSRLWHEEAIRRDQSSGSSWEPLGLMWSDDTKGLVVEEITTPFGLSEEGKVLKHCVGSYSDKCREGKHRIFSVKKDGARLSTLELTPPEGAADFSTKESGSLVAVKGEWSITQHKGRLNCAPSDEAVEAASSALEALNILWAKKVEERQSKEIGKLIETDGSDLQNDFNFDLPEMNDLETAKKLMDRRVEKSISSLLKKKK